MTVRASLAALLVIALVSTGPVISQDKEPDFKAYLEKYPKGNFAALARNRLAALGQPQVQKPQATAEKPREAAGPLAAGDSWTYRVVNVRAGKPVLGTCAGMIMLDREHLDVLDIGVRRNAFGRQLASFETPLSFDGTTIDAVFIRAPWVEDVGEGVEVLAEVDGHPVAVRQGNILAVAFHPELGSDLSLHRWLVDRVHAA